VPNGGLRDAEVSFGWHFVTGPAVGSAKDNTWLRSASGADRRKRRIKTWTNSLIVPGLAARPDASQTLADTVVPEGATAVVAGSVSPEIARALAAKAGLQPVAAAGWMVVAANPLAAKAGARVLREGGTAADAMVAVQSVPGLVEPQSSGLGGGVSGLVRCGMRKSDNAGWPGNDASGGTAQAVCGRDRPAAEIL
jgi:hypothetical protein